MAKITLPDILASFASAASLNSRFQDIEDALNSLVLYRDNPAGEPNAMQNDFDMNGNQILNLPLPVDLSDPVRLQDVQDALDSVVGTIPVVETRQIATAGQTIFDAPQSWVQRAEIYLVRVDGVMQQPVVDYDVQAGTTDKIEFTVPLDENMIVDILAITPNIAAVVGGSGSGGSAPVYSELPAGDGVTEISVDASAADVFDLANGSSAGTAILISAITGGTPGQTVRFITPNIATEESLLLDKTVATLPGANINLGQIATLGVTSVPDLAFLPLGTVYTFVYDGTDWRLAV